MIDLSDRAESTGKAAGTDLRAGVVTLPLLRLRELAPTDPSASSLLTRISTSVELAQSVAHPGAEATNSATSAGDEGFAEVVAELREHAVTARTLDDAREYADRAVAALEPVPDGPVKSALTEFARRVVDRDG